MASRRVPGPACRPGQDFTAWVPDSGTMCRQQSPVCLPIDKNGPKLPTYMCNAVEVPPAPDDPRELIVLSKTDFIKIVQESRAAASRMMREYKWLVADGLPLAKDIKDLSQLLREMGLKGTATFRTVQGKPYVVLSGYPGLRKILTGTRYKPSHVKVVELAIGRRGLARGAVRATRLSVILTVTTDVLEAVLSEDENLRRRLGLTIGVNITKEVVVSIAACAAGIAIAGVTSVAWLPVAGGIVVAVAVGYVLDKFVPTEMLLRKIEKAYAELIQKGASLLQEFEREIILQAWPVGTSLGH